MNYNLTTNNECQTGLKFPMQQPPWVYQNMSLSTQEFRKFQMKPNKNDTIYLNYEVSNILR